MEVTGSVNVSQEAWLLPGKERRLLTRGKLKTTDRLFLGKRFETERKEAARDPREKTSNGTRAWGGWKGKNKSTRREVSFKHRVVLRGHVGGMIADVNIYSRVEAMHV